MKRITDFLAFIACALLVVACGAMSGTSFNDRAAAIERNIQVVQVGATAMLRAEKITVAQDQQIQANLRVIHNGLVAAKAAQPKDPAGADADLEVVSKQVEALKVRTGVKP